jgi:hypothetical protein
MNYIPKIIKLLWELYKQYKVSKLPVVAPILPPEPVLPPKPILTRYEVENPQTGWGGYDGVYPEDKKNLLRGMVKEKCLKAGLTKIRTIDILNTIEGESGFNPYCTRLNNDKRKSTDYGLCQLNSYWYLRPYKMTGEEAIKNPERCVDIMIEAWKNGRDIDWIAWRGKDTEDMKAFRKKVILYYDNV